MQQRIEVISTLLKEDYLEFKTEELQAGDYTGLRASGRMLVDSDSLSFIYILETDEEFTYISLPKATWPDLKKVITNQLETVLVLDDQEILLESFIEEITYLISNIEGNANYGDEMVSEVEKVFVNL